MTFLRAIDLCCGAGGWAAAARGLPVEWVAVADLAGDCLETWALNHRPAHPGCRLLECDLSTEEGQNAVLDAVCADRRGSTEHPIDLICGAIPCEEVSTARGGIPPSAEQMATLGRLIGACFDLVKQLRPRWWVFEDVARIIPHLPTPLECGMPWEYRTIDASEYGPQRRTRVFFGKFPPLGPPQPGPRTLGEVLRPGPYRTLRRVQELKRSRSKWYGKDKCREMASDAAAPTVVAAPGVSTNNERGYLVRVLDANEASPTIAVFSSRHERAALVGAQARTLNAAIASPTITESYRCDDRTVPVRDPYGRERPMPSDATSRTIVCGSGGGNALPVEQDGLLRCLEWQEAALLQGFPSDYVFAASWSRTWKLLAQAIPIQVGRAILQGIVAEAGGAS